MKDLALVGNINGAFPSVSAKNCSGSATTDGTPLTADWVNNLWGFIQDLMYRGATGGITPSGVVEAYAAETGVLPLGTTSTQLRTAMQMAFGSPGELVFWCRSQAPATVGARILLLQGQTIAIASYKDLVAATYIGDALNNTAGAPFYKSSDSGGVTRATAGAYFTLPDARGCTIRGIDPAATRDPDGATRPGGGAAGNLANGRIQADAFQGHYHQINIATANVGGQSFGIQTYSDTVINFANTEAGAPKDGLHGTVRVATETRMWNMACHIGIRY